MIRWVWGQVDATCSGFFPHESDGIESDEFGSLGDVEKQDIQYVEQNIGVGVVEVDLVVAEGRPEEFLTGGGGDGGQ